MAKRKTFAEIRASARADAFEEFLRVLKWHFDQEGLADNFYEAVRRNAPMKQTSGPPKKLSIYKERV